MHTLRTGVTESARKDSQFCWQMPVITRTKSTAGFKGELVSTSTVDAWDLHGLFVPHLTSQRKYVNRTLARQVGLFRPLISKTSEFQTVPYQRQALFTRLSPSHRKPLEQFCCTLGIWEPVQRGFIALVSDSIGNRLWRGPTTIRIKK